MPSIPCSAASLASRRLWMPLSRIGPSQFARMSGSRAQLSPGVWETPANPLPAASQPSPGPALDALEQDRAVPVRADERQPVPAQPGVLEDARERDPGRQRTDL